MTRISVDTRSLGAASAAIQKTCRGADATSDTIGAVARSLDWKIAGREQYHRQVLRLQAEALRHSRLLERHAAFLTFAKSKYQMAETKIAGLSSWSPANLLEALGDLIVDKFGAILGPRILRLWEVLTGEGLVAGITTLAGWVTTSGTVDRGEIEQGLQDSHLKQQLRELRKLPGLSQSDWDKADLRGREKILERLTAEAAAVYGVDAKVGFYYLPPTPEGGYEYGKSDGVGTVYFNEYFIRKDSYTESMDTVFHELRHQYQADSMNNPDSFLVDDKTIDAWKKESGANYVQPSEDFDRYWAQVVEVDARDFGDEAAT